MRKNSQLKTQHVSYCIRNTFVANNRRPKYQLKKRLTISSCAKMILLLATCIPSRQKRENREFCVTFFYQGGTKTLPEALTDFTFHVIGHNSITWSNFAAEECKKGTYFELFPLVTSAEIFFLVRKRESNRYCIRLGLSTLYIYFRLI